MKACSFLPASLVLLSMLPRGGWGADDPDAEFDRRLKAGAEVLQRSIKLAEPIYKAIGAD